MAGEHKKTFLPLGDFHPDPPHVGMGLLRGCRNFQPMGQGYLAVPTPRAVDADMDVTKWTLEDDLLDVFSVNKLHTHYTNEIIDDPPLELSFDAVDVFIGGEGDLGILSGVTSIGPTLTNVNIGGIVGAYGAGDLKPSSWSMASWSWDSVVATNHSDPVQVYYYGGITGKFGEMITHGATTLRARHVSVLGKHVVLGNIIFEQDPLPTPNGTNADCLTYFGDATDLYHPEVVWWSGTDDETTFGDEISHPGENTSWQPLNDTPGSITGLCRVGDRALLIFKETSIYIMELTGSDELFHFSLLSSSVGTRYSDSIVQVGRDAYFIDTTGRPMVARNLSSVEPVGKGVVSSFFGTNYWRTQQLKEYDDQLVDVYPFVPSPVGVYSQAWDTVFWGYAYYARAVPGGGSSEELTEHRLLCYSVTDDKWWDYLVKVIDLNDGPEWDVAAATRIWPMCSFVYDKYASSGLFDMNVSTPGVIMFDPIHEIENAATPTKFDPAVVYIAALVDGSDASTLSVARTKLFSFNETSVASGTPATIHAIRPVHDNGNTGTFTFTVGACGAADLNTRVNQKSSGATLTRNGWHTVTGGGVSGDYFWITMQFSSVSGGTIRQAGPHIVGIEIEYSLGGESS